jgi:hypothetical protein
MCATAPTSVCHGLLRSVAPVLNYDKDTPLDLGQTKIMDRDGITIYDITYSSPLGDRGAVVGPNGGVVTAYLIVPPGKGPFPALIYGHW